MWIVASAKNIDFFMYEIKKKVSDIEFYYPKIKHKIKNKEEKVKNILGDYLFCYSKSFDEKKTILFNLKFLKGLKKILFSRQEHQKEIVNFINHCKLHESDNGLMQNTFFKDKIDEKGKIINGPFSNCMFNLINKDAKKIKVLIGEIEVSISDKSKFNYSTI